MKHFLTVLLFFILTFLHGYCQIGGQHAYEFLNLTTSPRVAALGGKLISHPGINMKEVFDTIVTDSIKRKKLFSDLSLVYHNPAQLNSEMNTQINMNYVSYFAGVKFGNISYSHNVKDRYSLAYGIQYIDYGSFTETDINGTITGSFSAAEYALNIAGSMFIDSSFTIGADIRPILSSYESYTSTGISTDLGITYSNYKNLFQMAFVVRNAGTQITTYSGEMESLPFELQLGYTQFLRYAPFNVSITAQHLERWDMSVKNDDSNSTSNINGEEKTSKRSVDKFSDQLMRHLIFGVEFTPFRNFYLRLGYNYQRRQELKIAPRPATAGISWGFGFSINRFQFNYARATYHLAGASNVFALTTSLNSFYRKK